MADGWVPRTGLEQMIHIDTLLAELIPGFRRARERIVDTLPGHSGRPAGSGDPGGGRGGGGGSSVVERTAAQWKGAGQDLERLDRLAAAIVDRLVERFPTVTGPADNGAMRRLVWARWVIRSTVKLGPGPVNRLCPARWRLALHQDVEQLWKIVGVWRDARETAPRSPELAHDDTLSLCRSCLRVGERVERSDRYVKDGLCRWCGDFRAEQGFLPTLAIVEAHRSAGVTGRALYKLIREERRARGLNKPSTGRKR